MFYESLANRVRGKIVSLLSANGPASTGEIEQELRGMALRPSEQLHIDRSTLIAHLNDLESLGLITGEPRRGHRQGRAVTWSVNAARRDGVLTEFSAFIQGKSDH